MTYENQIDALDYEVVDGQLHISFRKAMFIAADADAQIAALQAECEALRADMDWLEKRKQREARDGGYSAFFVIHVPAMASGPWQRDHGGEFDCKTLRAAIDNERSKA